MWKKKSRALLYTHISTTKVKCLGTRLALAGSCVNNLNNIPIFIVQATAVEKNYGKLDILFHSNLSVFL